MAYQGSNNPFGAGSINDEQQRYIQYQSAKERELYEMQRNIDKNDDRGGDKPRCNHDREVKHIA